MKAYDTFSPAIPDIEDLPITTELPAAVEVFREEPSQKREKAKTKTAKKNTATRKIKKEKKEGVNFFVATRNFFTGESFRWILGLFLGAFGIYLAISFISYFASCISDQSEINNTAIGMAGNISNEGGEGGARLSEFLINECFGLGSLVIVVWLIAMSLKQLAGRPKFKSVNFTIKCLVALITVSLIIGLVTIGLNSPVNWGGYHGRYVNEFVIHFLGWAGGVLLCLFMVGSFIVICMRDVIKWIIKWQKKRAEKNRIKHERRMAELAREKELEEMRRYEEVDQTGEYNAEQDLITEETFENMVFNGEETGLYGTLPDFDTEEYSLEEEEPADESSVASFSENEESIEAYTVTEELINLDEYSLTSEEPKQEKVEEKMEAEVEPIHEDLKSEEVNSISQIEETERETFLESESDVTPYIPVVTYQTEENEAYENREAVKESVSDELKETLGYGIEEELTSPEPEEPETVVSKERVVSEEEPLDVTPMEVNINQISQTSAKRTVIAPLLPGSFPYKFPPYNILREGKVQVIYDEDEQQENKDRIEKTLLDFKIPIMSIRATIGPTVTLYEIVPDKGIKVASIKRLADDIALSLAAEGVRIIAPIPGRGTVGIEVANKKPQMVSMQTVIRSKAFQQNDFKLPVAIGSTISNEVYITDLAKMPHLLVAGATGQGKSVGLNAIIASLLYSKRPDELKFVMIDPKMVEFSLYEKIESHYLAKIPGDEEAIITNMDKAVATLNSLVIEMENRYRLLKEIHTKNLIEYNNKVKEGLANPADGHRFLPYIVVIVDEFADLIMNVGKEVEMPVARLAQKARAVGIHVIIATQRPSADVITGLIKNNFPARIAFKVASGIDSKTILDTPGAQFLIGRGDMLILNNSPQTRVQCAFIDTDEVEALCEYIYRQPYGQGAYLLPEPEEQSSTEKGGVADSSAYNELDSLFPECARLVVSSNHASTSALQRNYSIGYNRAGKIMDQMEKLGIVGPSQGGKPRSVLVDTMSLETILANVKVSKY